MPLYRNTKTQLRKSRRPPDTPHALTVAAHETAQQIMVSWTDRAVGETSYKLQRSIDAGVTWIEIAWLANDSTYYIDRQVVRGSTYHYRVRAVNKDGNGHFSNIASGAVYKLSTSESNVVLHLVAEIGTKASGVQISQGSVLVDEWEDQSGD